MKYILIFTITLCLLYFFLTSQIAKRTKYILAAIVWGLVALAAYPAFIYWSFSRVQIIQIRRWQADSYTIVLSKVQGWAGSGSYQYELKKPIAFGLVEKTLAKQLIGNEAVEKCEIHFQISPKTQLLFDKCKEKIKTGI